MDGEVGHKPQYDVFADEFLEHAESGFFNACYDRPTCLALLNRGIAWARLWMEMSIVASDAVWRITEPLFGEFRSAYFHGRLSSAGHEDALREQMRRELGR